MTLVAQPIEAWWIDVLHESLDSVGSVQAGHFGNAMRNAVKLIDSTQQAGLCWISRRANGDEVLIISMNLSLNSWAVKAKGSSRVLPEPDAANARPRLHVSISAQLQEANVVGDDLMSLLSEGCNECRLSSPGCTYKRDAAVRNVNGRRMKRRNSALMTERSEHETEQIGPHLIIICGRGQVYQDFSACPQ